MNYKEKYNEILEWARKNKARLNGVPIEEVLPELAESEDERIRKALIKLMTVAGESYVMSATGFKKERLLAWLEKQKEQKLLPGFDDLTLEEKMNHPLYLEGFNVGREVGHVEAEQKPAEWSEEEKK